MTHISAGPYELWSLLTLLASVFFVSHIYKFDRFHCFKWSKNAHKANFKRFMIYSYALNLPCLLAYGIGYAVIKFQEGYLVIGQNVYPNPSFAWTQSHKNAIIPLYFVLALAWALEITTHLEELCFWMFLVHSRNHQEDWFKTIWFKIWAVGSVGAFVLMFSITGISRANPLVCEAYTFMAGSTYGLFLTVCFIPILIRFPRFLKNLKDEGIDHATVVRLIKCHELNVIRFFFRFVFLVPFLALAIDGVRPHHHVNENVFLTDLLVMIGVLGCFISSILTILIFFPRDIEAEIQREADRTVRRHESKCSTTRKGTIAPWEHELKPNKDKAGGIRNSYPIAGEHAAIEQDVDIASQDSRMAPIPSRSNTREWNPYDEHDIAYDRFPHDVEAEAEAPFYRSPRASLLSQETYSYPTPQPHEGALDIKAYGHNSNPLPNANSLLNRQLSFPLTSHNLTMHSNLVGGQSKPYLSKNSSKKALSSFRSPIDFQG